mmetsp:Transcript_23269/g.53775  ORF Transcript_23269/g.53775 Transcript_23269/m.53775 type:complete len:250 (-) Transcript_23269:126-875(-)
MDHARVLDRLVEHGQSVMQRALRLVQDVHRRAAQHNGARLVLGAPRELDDLVLADHHLGDLLAGSQLRLLWVVEGRHDVRPQDCGQALGAVEVGVLDGHDASLLEQLLGVIVDQLTVDEHVAAVLDNAVHLRLHLLPLRLLDLGDGLQGVHLHAGAVDFYLVRVHLAVRDEDLAILHHLGHADADFLLEDEALLEEGVLQRGARLLQDLDVVQVRLPPQSQDGVDGELREVVLLVFQKLRAQCRPCDSE